MYVLSTCLLYINNNIFYQIFILYHFNMIIGCMIQVSQSSSDLVLLLYNFCHSAFKKMVNRLVSKIEG